MKEITQKIGKHTNSRERPLPKCYKDKEKRRNDKRRSFIIGLGNPKSRKCTGPS